MAQGLIAMMDLAQSSDPDDEDLKRIKELAQEMKADRDGSSVEVSVNVPANEVTKLIEEELSDH
jgi:hypothetical protein